MALVKTTINDQIGGLFYIDEAASSTKVTLGTSGTFSIHQIKIDNTGNTHKSYLKIYTADPTVGTSDPQVALPCEASATSEYSFESPIGMSNIYYAVVREAGTAGTTAPANAITVKFLITSA